MDFLQPATWAEALAMKAAHPEALPIAGGTDVMVEINFDRQRPASFIDLKRIAELTHWGEEGNLLRVGAGVTYTRLIDELGDRLPGLAMAARTVGSPQIRNRGTVGGNLGAASPGRGCHPPLLAPGAADHGHSAPAAAFCPGVKQNAPAPDELIAAVLIPPAAGPQQFSKIGTRNAMVIAVASFCLVLDIHNGRVGTGIGSPPPPPRRAAGAERFLAGALAEAGLWESRADLPASVTREFGDLVS